MTFATDLRKFALLVALGACLLVGAASRASAQTVCLAQGQARTFNYTSSFGAAGSATATFNLSGNVLTVNYTNNSTEGTYLSGIAFNTNLDLPEDGLSVATATGGWGAEAGPGGGLGNYQLIAYGNGKKRLTPGASGTAVFILSSAPPELCVEKTIAHLTSLPNGGSEKPVGVPGNGGGSGGPID